MTNFRKNLDEQNTPVQKKLGPDLTRALMTSPGKDLKSAVDSFQRKVGRTIHNPLAANCDCPTCFQQRMEMQPIQGPGLTGMGGL